MALASASRRAMRIQWVVSSFKSHPSSNLPQRCCAISIFSKRLERDIRIGPVSPYELGKLIHVSKSPGNTSPNAIPKDSRSRHATLPAMKTKRRLAALALAAVAVLGATTLLPARVEQVAREVEKVRGRRFERAVPASEIDAKELKKVLRSKVAESFPAPPEDTLRTLVALGLIDETPNLLERLVDFYASQVIAFYDPEPRRFYIVRGAEKALQKKEADAREEADSEAAPGGAAGMAGMAEKLIFANELTHALQDETLRLDRRMKDLKENGDRGLALQSLLEGEATLVMVRVALTGLPGADESAEEMLEPLLSAGALERSGVPRDLPDFFVDQLFFP